MKKFLLFFLFIFSTISLKSNPPEYIINSIAGNVVTFENQASFEIAINQSLSLSGWEIGDSIIVFPIEGELSSSSPEFQNGELILPGLILRNLTRKNTLRAKLIVAPSPSQNGVFTITQIDLALRRITLDDASEWIFSPANFSTVALWDVGQIVMIGQSTRPSASPAMFFFNADKPSIARVVQQ